MKKYALPILILIMSILYMFVIPSEPKFIKVIFKIVPMVLIILYTWIKTTSNRHFTIKLLMIGLVFCTLGDIFIAYSFVYGLVAFLVGHIFYLIGFIRGMKFSWFRFTMIIPIAVYSFLMGRELVNALTQTGNDTLIVPVIAYVTIISLMAWSAILTGNRFAIIGSLLFVASDSILAWNQFVSDISYSNLFIMTTYYAAQFLIAHSAGSFSKSTR